MNSVVRILAKDNFLKDNNNNISKNSNISNKNNNSNIIQFQHQSCYSNALAVKREFAQQSKL